MSEFDGRLAIVQRVLTPYRAPFFDALAARCTGGLCVLAGRAAAWEDIAQTDRLEVAELRELGNRHALRGRLTVYWQTGALRELRACRPDVIVAEANPRGLSTRAIVRWAHRRGRPVIGWGMGASGLSPGLARLRAQRRRRFLRPFDAMIAYGSRAAAEYRSAGLAPERVFVCNNAAAPVPAEAPARAPTFAGRPIVLFVGRLTAEKRVDVLLRACAALAADGPRDTPELRVVGDGQARAALEALASRQAPGTRFLGPLYGDRLVEQFRQADLFVLPDRGGLAVQEAMSHALPIVVGAGDGTQDDLVRAENGWHVTPGDPHALATTIRTALSDVAKLRAKGAASLRIVSEEINADLMVDSFLNAVVTVNDAYASSAGTVNRRAR